MTVSTVHDHSIASLETDLVQLSKMTIQSLVESVTALVEHDIERARQVCANDIFVNGLRYDIEQSSYEIITMQQPVAKSMRVVVSTINIATNLERIADHAADIAG